MKLVVTWKDVIKPIEYESPEKFLKDFSKAFDGAEKPMKSPFYISFELAGLKWDGFDFLERCTIDSNENIPGWKVNEKIFPVVQTLEDWFDGNRPK